MRRFPIVTPAAVTLAVVAVGGALRISSHVAPSPAPIWIGAVRTEAEARSIDIAFYERRAARDPTGAMDLARLAALYQQRARETGNYEDVLRAEAAARRSLHNRTTRNASAAQVLASALLSEHRFADALVVAARLAAEDPDRVSYRAARGEIEMELGRYDEARATFDSLAAHSRELPVASRLARWAEIEGHPDEARWRLKGALRDALTRPDLPREQIAWFWLRVGDVEMRSGWIDSAEHSYRQGLAAHPDDYRLLAAVARLDAARHRWADAIAAGNRAIASNLDPATFGTISDAYLAMGDRAKADEYARGMEVAVSKQPGSYHRAWSLFLLDHNRRVGDVLRKARAELQTRRDIYGWDVLAWALYRQGRYAAAERAMTAALGQNTHDALLFYHAGMIAYALAHRSAARQDLGRAIAINPYFHPTQPDTARAILSVLAQDSVVAGQAAHAAP
jgi:tetratricopeptide (TPR) repeat protein